MDALARGRAEFQQLSFHWMRLANQCHFSEKNGICPVILKLCAYSVRYAKSCPPFRVRSKSNMRGNQINTIFQSCSNQAFLTLLRLKKST